MSRFGLTPELDELILDCGEVGFLLWRKGWCEGAAGNLSCAITPTGLAPQGPPRTLTTPVPVLDGREYLVKTSGCRFRDIAKDPERCLGIVRVIDGGRAVLPLWGLRGGGRPTSELSPHLAVHSRRAAEQRAIGVVLHAHATNLIALSFVERFRRDPELLTGILYRMHTEAYQGLPDGIAYIGFRVPGGEELASDAANALSRHEVALWSHHGVIAAGATPSQAMDLLEYADKAAQLFLMASQRNDQSAYLSEQDLRDLKEAYRRARAAR